MSRGIEPFCSIHCHLNHHQLKKKAHSNLPLLILLLLGFMTSTKTALSFAFTTTTTFSTSAITNTIRKTTPLLSPSFRSHKSSSSSLKMSSESKKISIAILGGGISGLSCASHLSSSSTSNNFDITVFDTGRLRPGGRCSSRYPNDKPKHKNDNVNKILNQHIIDHAAQILTIPQQQKEEEKGFSEFQRQVEEWEKKGVLTQFPKGSVVELRRCSNKKDEKDNKEDFQIVSLNTKKTAPNMYYATNGMGSIPQSILSSSSSNFKLHQDVWISPSNGVKYIGSTNIPKWKIQSSGKQYGTFDQIIIAHNGKCADRIMSKTPAKSLHSLLRTNFAPSVSAAGGKRMTLNSIYSLTFALRRGDSPLKEKLGENVYSVFIKNEPNLKFASCHTRKYPSSKKEDNVEVWTVLSSAKFGKKYKGPQENLPKELVEEVTGLLLTSLERCLNLQDGSLWKENLKEKNGGVVLDCKLQLWGAAVPLNTWTVDIDGEDCVKKSGFLYDAENGVGACGDWLLHPSIGGAWESGRRLANWIADQEEADGSKKGNNEHHGSVGLPPHGKFVRSASANEAGIASFK